MSQPERTIRCRHCETVIYCDTMATGHLGCWRSVDGTACTHHAGHIPELPPVPTTFRPGY